MKKMLLYFPATIICLSSCYLRQVYYVSPYNGNNDHYHTMPLKSDSVKSATFVGGNFYSGDANSQSSDYVFAFDGNISRSQQFGLFEAYYGADISLGNYKVATVDSYYNSPTVNAQIINSMAGHKFFGGGGLSGGINIVLPLGNGSEWRILGFEASSHNEFGDYLAFRNKLPDSSTTLDIKNNFFTTYGFYSEIMIKTRHGSVGFRIASGNVLEPAYNNLNIYDDQTDQYLSYGYFNFTFDYTYDKWTGYMQTKFATKASGINFGANYRLGKMKN